MTTFCQIALVIFALVIGLFDLWKDVFSESTRKYIRNTSIVILLIIAMLSILNTLGELSEHQKSAEQREIEYKNTSVSLKIAIDSLRSIQNHTMRILDSTRGQLKIQRETNEFSKTLVAENKLLVTKQQSTFEHVDRILNPLPELVVVTQIKFSFTNERLKPLKEFLIKELKARDSLGGLHKYHVILEMNNDSLLERIPNLYERLVFPINYKLQFVKGKFDKFSDIKAATPRVMYSLNSFGNSCNDNFFELQASFLDSMCYLTSVFRNCSPSGLNENIGLNDLQNSCIIFDPESDILTYELESLEISLPSGHRINIKPRISDGLIISKNWSGNPFHKLYFLKMKPDYIKTYF